MSRTAAPPDPMGDIGSKPLRMRSSPEVTVSLVLVSFMVEDYLVGKGSLLCWYSSVGGQYFQRSLSIQL